MSFRNKIFLIFLITVLASVSLVAYGVTYYTQRSFEQIDAQRTEALVAQFKKEFAQRGEMVVQQVENITNAASILRDLAMIRVACTAENRPHVLSLVGIFRGHVVDVAADSLTVEITGTEEKINGLLEVLRPYGVLEMVRTGIVGMRRGNCPAGEQSAPDEGFADNSGIAFSV